VEADDTTTGVCYRVPKEKVEEVLDQLDFREKGGYTRAIVEVQRPDLPSVDALLYTANPSNPNFFMAEPSEAAAIIATAVGPSGPNLVYFERLAEWLDSVGEVDPHIDLIRSIISDGEAKPTGA